MANKIDYSAELIAFMPCVICLGLFGWSFEKYGLYVPATAAFWVLSAIAWFYFVLRKP